MIGIFGGTFDPVHYGHLRSALEVQEIFALKEIRFIPSARPPHRKDPGVSPELRLAMLELAIDDQPGFIVDRREVDRSGPSYMVLTLASLRNDFPGTPLILFLGSDAFNKITGWYQWQRLFDFAHIVVLMRPGSSLDDMNADLRNRCVDRQDRLSAQLCGLLYFQPITQLEISASAIRSLIAEGKSPRYLLPDNVLGFIAEKRLYQIT